MKSAYIPTYYDRMGKLTEPPELKHIPIGRYWDGTEMYLDDGAVYVVFDEYYVPRNELSIFLTHLAKIQPDLIVEMVLENENIHDYIVCMDAVDIYEGY